MTEQVMLALKLGFVAALYLFAWRVVRVSLRDVRAAPGAALRPRRARAKERLREPRLIVLSSPVYPPGTLVRLDGDVTFGRNADVDVPLEADAYASGQHARVVVAPDGTRVLHDLGSRNGTYVRGYALAGEHVLVAGDEVRIGETELRYEE